MEIICVNYLKHGSFLDGDIQYVTTEWIIKSMLIRLQKGFEHLNWIGVIDNSFTCDIMIYALIFYNGKWNGKKIMDRIISDIKDPWNNNFGILSPFSVIWEKTNFNRKPFITKLKGGEIF